jgi:hypothetical protein
MISFVVWMLLGFLILISIIDWKVMAIPSVMLTAMLFTVAVLFHANLWIGILGFVMAWMLYEAQFYTGIADVKVFTIVAFMLSTIGQLFLFIILVLVFGMAWKGFWHWKFKKRKKKVPDVFPFIPVFVFAFLVMLIAGVFA